MKPDNYLLQSLK